MIINLTDAILQANERVHPVNLCSLSSDTVIWISRKSVMMMKTGCPNQTIGLTLVHVSSVAFLYIIMFAPRRPYFHACVACTG